jgi:hypothetical protein
MDAANIQEPADDPMAKELSWQGGVSTGNLPLQSPL